MAYTTLISTDALQDNLTNSSFAIIDCRAALGDHQWGRNEYRARHISGAVHADLEHDLSGPKTGQNGRHPLPDPRTLAETFSRLGIARGIQVVAYDQDNGMYASRLWWLLRWLGHDDAAVLDGGFAKWIAERRPTSTGEESRAPRAFGGAPREDMVVDVSRVDALRRDSGWRVIDARAPERFRGENETIDRAAGHIPGAINRFFKNNVGASGTFLAADALRASLAGTLGPTPPDRIVCYCGSGVTACHNVLALEHAGLHGAKLYPGSWSEWSADPKRPVAKGTDSESL